MCRMRIIHSCSCENYGVITEIFTQMVSEKKGWKSENSGVDSPFQQKFKCNSSKMSCAHCTYSSAVFCVQLG